MPALRIGVTDDTVADVAVTNATMGNPAEPEGLTEASGPDRVGREMSGPGPSVQVSGLFTVGLAELTGAHTATLPGHFG